MVWRVLAQNLASKGALGFHHHATLRCNMYRSLKSCPVGCRDTFGRPSPSTAPTALRLAISLVRSIRSRLFTGRQWSTASACFAECISRRTCNDRDRQQAGAVEEFIHLFVGQFSTAPPSSSF